MNRQSNLVDRVVLDRAIGAKVAPALSSHPLSIEPARTARIGAEACEAELLAQEESHCIKGGGADDSVSAPKRRCPSRQVARRRKEATGGPMNTSIAGVPGQLLVKASRRPGDATIAGNQAGVRVG